MSVRLCRHCQGPIPAMRGPCTRHCSQTCRQRYANRRAWARKKYVASDPPRLCPGCRRAINPKRSAVATHCSTKCRDRHRKRQWCAEDISAAEIDRLFEAEAARKRALRWRAA